MGIQTVNTTEKGIHMPKLDAEGWANARADHHNGMSYRDIAKKYNVSLKTVAARAKLDEWGVSNKIIQESIKKKAAEDAGYESARLLFECADLLATKVAKVLERDDLRPADYRALSGALKDIRDIKDIKSERDIREQEARISKLEKEAEGEQKDMSGYGVFVLPAIKEVKKPDE